MLESEKKRWGKGVVLKCLIKTIIFRSAKEKSFRGKDGGEGRDFLTRSRGYTFWIDESLAKVLTLWKIEKHSPDEISSPFAV